MSMSIGCVGCGNMGGAILAGLAASSLDCTLYGHTRTAARMAPLEAAGVTRLDSARELARKARYVVMAVKPYQIEALLAEMAPEFGPDTVVISVAAGISIARLQAAVGGRCPVVRCMPNTPGQGPGAEQGGHPELLQPAGRLPGAAGIPFHGLLGPHRCRACLCVRHDAGTGAGRRHPGPGPQGMP